MRSFFKSILIPSFLLASSALALQACGSDTNAGACVPNSSQACACRTGGMGVQTCLPNGTFEACSCGAETGGAGGAGGGSSSSSSSSSGQGGMMNCHDLPNTPVTCGNGTKDDGEECDDGNCIAADECNNNCKLPYCGDKVVQPPETCDGGEQCPADCAPMMTTSSSSSGTVDPCMGKLIFAGFAAAQVGGIEYNGQIGLDGANAACQSLGAFGMCDYEQWKQLELDPMTHSVDITKLGSVIPNGSCNDVWLQRTTVAMDATCPGGMSAPGPGGNCNNWNYKTGHRSNGEHVNVCNMGGTITYKYTIDCDTVFDDIPGSPHVGAGMPCSPVRPIPCCYEKCISP